jgi:hypothetical protein
MNNKIIIKKKENEASLATLCLPGQPGVHNDTLSQKQTQNQN